MYTYFSDIGLSLEKKQYSFNDKIKSMWLRGVDFICFGTIEFVVLYSVNTMISM